MASVDTIATVSNAFQLIQRITRQDERALIELYQAYGNLVYSLALRVLQNPGLAEEVTQNVFRKT